ncbi:MAG: HD domain-containing protein [Ruminococcaceae bacterium]|nr:HD domain-containing protein [Oscillospiraceae bacterium]
MEYSSLSKDLQNRIIKKNPRLAENMNCSQRRRNDHDIANLWRPAYVRDCEKILHCPYYNRYSDKTQVFSFYKNDDISRRSLHVQLVSRISRNISSLLGLNVDLTEAIALGHDLGHPPFGHAGESCLNELSLEYSSKGFMHNIHSVRVLDRIFDYNISFETLDGILCHNGELPLGKYVPQTDKNFDVLDREIEECYKDSKNCAGLIPATLEGCVVRISDLIAYLGKDRQDAKRAKVIETEDMFDGGILGKFNAVIINNLIVNVIENSFDKPYIKIDDEYYDDLKKAMDENYRYIYLSDTVKKVQQETIRPMYFNVFKKLLSDIRLGRKDSYIFRHHINYINNVRSYYSDIDYFESNTPEDIVVDYIASMTDDYFSDLYEYYYPDFKKPEYVSYFK